jgi:hypothetical protein
MAMGAEGGGRRLCSTGEGKARLAEGDIPRAGTAALVEAVEVGADPAGAAVVAVMFGAGFAVGTAEPACCGAALLPTCAAGTCAPDDLVGCNASAAGDGATAAAAAILASAAVEILIELDDSAPASAALAIPIVIEEWLRLVFRSDSRMSSRALITCARVGRCDGSWCQARNRSSLMQSGQLSSGGGRLPLVTAAATCHPLVTSLYGIFPVKSYE